MKRTLLCISAVALMIASCSAERAKGYLTLTGKEPSCSPSSACTDGANCASFSGIDATETTSLCVVDPCSAVTCVVGSCYASDAADAADVVDVTCVPPVG